MADFVHLHNHTHYSLLDAACTPDTLLAAAAADGQTALALTDHGVMFGCFEFYKKAKTHGIKPIIGVEAYVALGKRTDRQRVQDAGKLRNYYHLVLLAKNETGYRNLVKLTSIAHTEGFYYKPRIDWELLREHHEGLIATSACLAGPINAPLLAGDFETARTNGRLLKDIFGDDFYVELQDHGLPEDKLVLEHAPLIARELGVKIVVSNDTHYVRKEHAVAHNVLLHINKDTSSRSGPIDIRNELRYRVPEMYLKSQQEMKRLFKAFPEGIETTLEIAEKVDLKISTDLQMPKFDIPLDSSAETLDDYLEELTMKGLDERYPAMTKDILDRAQFELSVIRRMGYAGYFLIVWDFIRAARSMGVRVGPGRGSAAGSLVAYALRITDLDPLKYDLLFERFLNPERVSMPDIDVDFADDKRDLVIEYVKRKYGAESVAQIITFGTLSSKAVLKDVGRVLGIEIPVINSITDKIPVFQGKVKPLAEALELPELRWVKDSSDPKIKELVEYALVLEGFSRNSSLHAAGVVIAPGPISDYVPVYKTPQTEPATQYNMKDLEAAGLLKMDFLGLRTLTIIDNTLELIRRNHGVEIDLDAVTLDDPKVYELFGRGHTMAVFQFESDPMQNYMRQLKPQSLEDLIAMNALYRPGPMDNIPLFIERKQSGKEITYLHPKTIPILERTYGVIVYQEQVMQLVQVIAGFSLAQADLMRRAMGKKDEKEMAKQRDKFVEGAVKNSDMPTDLANQLFDLIAKFAQYGFNKSHSAAYAYLAYQTAYLKAHYPAEFLAANMTAELGDRDKIVLLMQEAKRFGVKVVPPDVNRSIATFSVEDGVIYFGMAGVKNVGVSAVEAIIKARAERPFTSIYDFTMRVPGEVLNRRVMEALVSSGAFDSLKNGHRAQLFLAIDNAIEVAKTHKGRASMGMDQLFGNMNEQEEVADRKLPDIDPWPELERLMREKDVLNFYISGHPLDRHGIAVQSFTTINLQHPDPRLDKTTVHVCGLITDVRTRLDKRENTIAFVKLEQFSGSTECIFWADKYRELARHLKPNNVVVVSGKAELSGENVKIVVDDVVPIEAAAKKLTKGYVIRLFPDAVSDQTLQQLRARCAAQGAHEAISFCVMRPDGPARYDTMMRINVSEENTTFLTTTFGESNVRFAM
jgi:DNA polymerase-3 subunit alpha